MKDPRDYLIQVVCALAGIILIICAVFTHSTMQQNIAVSVGSSVLASSLLSIFLLSFAGNPFSKMEKAFGTGISDVRRVFEQTASMIKDAEATGLVRVASSRSDFSTGEWIIRLREARRRVFIIAYAMDFLSEHDRFHDIMREKCLIGCRIQILLADPEGEFVKHRNIEEANEGSIKSRVETSIQRLRPLLKHPELSVRLYDAPLYCSVFGFDDEMIVTPHLYGLRGARAPVMIIKMVKDGLFSRYLQHFEDVWAIGTSPSNANVVKR